MTTDRKNAIIVGVLFILATVAALVGLKLYGPILSGQDVLLAGAEHRTQLLLGALSELILVGAAIGTAIMLFPYLKKHNESLALGYVCFRFLEAVVITVGIVSVLSLLTLSQQFVAAAAPDVAAFHASETVLLAVQDWTFRLGPGLILGINTMMCSYLLLRTKLVPRPISVLGMTGATLITIAGLLGLFGVIAPLSTLGLLLALPVAAYEMILAVWLIAKGFNVTASVSEPARTETRAPLAAHALSA
jgi:hypothetical protein